MDQWKQTIQQSRPTRERTEVEAKDANVARKVHKADREKLRRDRLNEQFVELGNVLDPDRPKNDKASIIIDTIQVLKDLTTEVNRLKAEYATLTEESRELTQEKNELREEKASIKSDIDNLNVQYQQRVRVMFPWGAIDPSVALPPPYSFPVVVPVPSGPVPLQPFPFFRNQNPGAISHPPATFIPYNPVNPHINQSCTAYAPSCSSNKQDSANKSLDRLSSNNPEKGENSSDVVTELELKTPGSSGSQELPSGDRKGKQLQKKEKCAKDGICSSSRYKSSIGFQDSSSHSVSDNQRSSG